MKKFTIVQWGKNRSVVKEFNLDTKEETFLILDNTYLMFLDESGVFE